MNRFGLTCMIPVVLLLLAWGCASAQGNYEESAIAIVERDRHFHLTVPTSKLEMRLPTGFVRTSPPEERGATLNPRYFIFMDEAQRIILSGWFEPESKFKGVKALWEEDPVRLSLPGPRDVSFSSVSGWDTISFNMAPPLRSNTHLRAHWIQSGTWIELRLSCYDDRTMAEQRAALVEVLRAVQVTEKASAPDSGTVTDGRVFEETLARAEKGEVFAQQVMGVAYLLGSGAPRDHVAARFWLRKAAEQGDMPAQRLLGMMLEQGWGGTQDYAEALTWYRKAAEQGYAVAQSSLATMYAEGRGVPQDSVRAYMWMSLAAPSLPDNAKKEATDILAKLARDMTPQQLEQAQAMAQACRAARYQNCDQSLPTPPRSP